MSDFVIRDNRTEAEKAAGKRSEHAQREATAAAQRDPRMAGADMDAYAALEDFVQDRIREGDFTAPAPGEQLSENKTRHAVPGRPDLEFIRGNGIGGCRYIVISRVPVQPVHGYVTRKSWADEEQEQDVDETEKIEQTVSVRRR